jgi:hypothetical protein
MNFIISFEFISLIVTIAIIMVTKLHKRLICFVLRTTKISLPPRDKDLELIRELKKQKDYKATGLVRSCTVMEYLEAIKDENIMDLDLIVFFYTACFLNILTIEIYKFIIGHKAYSEKIEQGVTDDTVTSSFTFITIIYILYVQYKQTFSKGFRSWDAKLFYGLFVIFIGLFGLMYYFNFDQYIVSIDYSKTCSFLNNRYEKVLTEAGTIKDHVFCTTTSLKVFYTIVNATIMAFLFRPCCRISYFDNIIISEEKTFEEQSSLKSMSILCKLKVIITAFLLFVFINALFKNQILKTFSITDYDYKLYIIPLFLLLEVSTNFFLIKYYSNLFHLRNYYEMIDFCNNPVDKALPFLKHRMSNNNIFFWECFINIFDLTFLPSILYLFYINRSGLLFDNKPEMDTFLESFSYLFLTVLVIAKSIFSTGYLIYLQNSNKRILI